MMRHVLAVALLLTGIGFFSHTAAAQDDVPVFDYDNVGQGALVVEKDDGSTVLCPLKHTHVSAQITGFLARVDVTQTFHNPLDEPIEAVYIFPLPHKSAVDAMTMDVGDRRIIGIIKRRDAARKIYEQALAQGQTAALLEQERPNIFTQSVGNIAPGQEVRIEISYVDVLEYDRGQYEFHFPMVVGPRFIPGKATSKTPQQGTGRRVERTGVRPPRGAGTSPDTDAVPDASRITPPVLRPDERNGHDISLEVTLQAGVPIQGLRSLHHEIEEQKRTPAEAVLSLANDKTIPNKDFVLRYDVVGKKPEMALLPHHDGSNGYFLLMVQPREDEALKQEPPREIVFLVDTSGSMQGRPTAQVRQTMQHLLKACRPDKDTFQVITFAGSTYKMFDGAVPATEQNMRKALKEVDGFRSGGGTHMLAGVRAAIKDSLDPERVRVVLMLTDGFIGNEEQIIAEVGRSCGGRIRFWCFGIGNSVNRFLVDGVARQGGGMGKVIGLNEDPGPTALDAMARLQQAQMSDVRIDWGGMDVYETYPARIPDLCAGRPIILLGRYDGGEREASLLVSGHIEGQPVSWPLKARFPAQAYGNSALASTWARHKIEDLMHSAYYSDVPEIEEAVTDIALEYRLMSPYTSFVAVDAREKLPPESARPPRRLLVPVPLPEGVAYEGLFATADDVAEYAFPVEIKDHTETELLLEARGAFGYRTGSGSKAMGAYGGRAARPRGARNAGTLRRARRPQARRKHFIQDHATASVRGWSGSLGVGGGGAGAESRPVRGGKVVDPAARRKEAQKLRELAAALLAKLRYEHARGKAALAYLLESSLATRAPSGKLTRTKALLIRIQTARRTKLEQAEPRLKQKVDMVLRDQALSEALQKLSDAADLPIRLVPGSEEDAAAALNRRDLHVAWLNLGHVPVSNALDWLLHPRRLQWELADDGVRVFSARRSAFDEPWVYDLMDIATPIMSEFDDAEIEFQKGQNRRQQIAAYAAQYARQQREALLRAVTARLDRQPAPDDRVFWYSDGLLLVEAGAEEHARLEKLFAQLRDPQAELHGETAALHQRTVARHEKTAKMLAARRRRERIGALKSVVKQNALRLAAEAARGKTDEEALIRLLVAARHEDFSELVQRNPALFAAAAWCVKTSRQALDEAQIDNDSADALKRIDAAMQKILTAERAALLQKLRKYSGASNVQTVTFAALVLDDQAFTDEAVKILAAMPDDRRPGVLQGDFARKLLQDDRPDAADVEKLLRNRMKNRHGEPLQGDNAVLLAGLTCWQAGGDAWTAFRDSKPFLLGNQQLEGGTLTLLGRLGRGKLVPRK